MEQKTVKVELTNDEFDIVKEALQCFEWTIDRKLNGPKYCPKDLIYAYRASLVEIGALRDKIRKIGREN